VPRTAAIAVATGAAAGSLVLVRDMGVMPALFLLALVGAYDTGNYLVGTGATNTWEGPAAGIAAMASVTLAFATLAVPPFKEAGPWVLGGLAALLSPFGPYAGAALTARVKKLRVPALRRVDALILTGPVWAVAAALLRST
jgi:CDP-diglyceride synthetase